MTEKRHDRPSKEPGSRVVCSALAAMGSSFSSSNTKMVFDSKSEAKAGLKKFDPSHKQKPYLCQHCGYWHLGNNTKVSTTEQTFIVPVKNELLFSSRLIPGTPLAEAVSNLSMSQYVPNEQMMEKMAKEKGENEELQVKIGNENLPFEVVAQPTSNSIKGFEFEGNVSFKEENPEILNFEEIESKQDNEQ